MADYRKACGKDVDRVYALVQETIRTVYPRYYPAAVVDYFAALHSRERIERDIDREAVWVLCAGAQLLGTGSRRKNHITRLFVLPSAQGRGHGSALLKRLEEEAAQEHDTAVLDASLPALGFYDRRGYHGVRHEAVDVAQGAVLVYEVMEKHLKKETGKEGG